MFTLWAAAKRALRWLWRLKKFWVSLITAGIVNVPYGAKKETRIIELIEASHPIPDQAGVEGTRRMMAIAEKADADDLVICLISGGGSSLMPLPRDGHNS